MFPLKASEEANYIPMPGRRQAFPALLRQMQGQTRTASASATENAGGSQGFFR